MPFFELLKADGFEYRICSKHKEYKEIRNRWTHFISIPLNLDGSLNQSYANLCDLSKSLIPEFDESALLRPKRLHLTICMLYLPESKDIEAVGRILGSRHVLDALKQTRISIQDFAIMRGSLQRAHVIHGLPEATNNGLDSLSKYIKSELGKILPPTQYDAQETKWHCTIINTKYSKHPHRGYDVSNFLKATSGYSLGSVDITELHLSCLEQGERSESEYYPHQIIIKIK